MCLHCNNEAWYIPVLMPKVQTSLRMAHNTWLVVEMTLKGIVFSLDAFLVQQRATLFRSNEYPLLWKQRCIHFTTAVVCTAYVWVNCIALIHHTSQCWDQISIQLSCDVDLYMARKHCKHVGSHTMSRTYHILCSSRSSALSSSHASSENAACRRVAVIMTYPGILRSVPHVHK